MIGEVKRSAERRGGTLESHEKRPVENTDEFSAPGCLHTGAVVGVLRVPLVPDTRFPIMGSAGAIVNSLQVQSTERRNLAQEALERSP